jgi:hypothetical protein
MSYWTQLAMKEQNARKREGHSAPISTRHTIRRLPNGSYQAVLTMRFRDSGADLVIAGDEVPEEIGSLWGSIKKAAGSVVHTVTHAAKKLASKPAGMIALGFIAGPGAVSFANPKMRKLQVSVMKLAPVPQVQAAAAGIESAGKLFDASANKESLTAALKKIVPQAVNAASSYGDGSFTSGVDAMKAFASNSAMEKAADALQSPTVRSVLKRNGVNARSMDAAHDYVQALRHVGQGMALAKSHPKAARVLLQQGKHLAAKVDAHRVVKDVEQKYFLAWVPK